MSRSIRPLAEPDFEEAHAIINEAAEAYRGVIPADRWHEPYMSREELRQEIAAGVEFSVLVDDGRMVGVMGVQQVRDALLVRHAYVRKAAQRQGTGSALMKHLLANMRGRVMVGTWAAAQWAIRFYERHGFRLTAPDEKDRLLSTYWSIPDRQRETSVVLILEESEKPGG
ncbi:MAG TPA: GNAT family N-acetyltransferase [Usitatibacter sp.]|nr:GNAT family N-acetyltransferase [Usitatibacter sp.]